MLNHSTTQECFIAIIATDIHGTPACVGVAIVSSLVQYTFRIIDAANRNGYIAKHMEANKRDIYLGVHLVPFVVGTGDGGRPGLAARTFIASVFADGPQDRAASISQAWATLASVLHHAIARHLRC